MTKDRKQNSITVAAFSEAEEVDIAYYASVSWQESVATVEQLRKQVWKEDYEKRPVIEKVIAKRLITQPEDELE